MRSIVFYFSTLATFFFSLKNITAEKFSIPAEILDEYLNMSKSELYEKCEEKNMHCRTVIGLETLEVIEQKNGERLLELLVKRAREDPPLNEELWQKAMDRHCHRDIVLQTIFDIGWNYVFPCVSELTTINPKGIENVIRNYLPMYCARVERIAKQRIARREH